MIVDKHGGEVPSDVDALLALPGIGDYTARAVAAFAFHQGVPVVDTNVRRVYARLVAGSYLTPPARKRELIDVAELLPRTNAWKFSLALMELGALVCTPAPKCELCPLEGSCAWRAAGSPAPSEEEQAAARKRVQKFEGTDRQCRGRIMALLRESPRPVAQAQIDAVWPDGAQRSRALFSLLEDGLVEQTGGIFHLPQ